VGVAGSVVAGCEGGIEVAFWVKVLVGVGDSDVGSLVGACVVGSSVGSGVAVSAGSVSVGSCVGSSVAVGVGSADGERVGSETLGSAVGTAVGSAIEPEGRAVGSVTSSATPQPARTVRSRRAAALEARRADGTGGLLQVWWDRVDPRVPRGCGSSPCPPRRAGPTRRAPALPDVPGAP
jgi:hypothetical protein